MRDWVRFHRELCKGTKRTIPRELRFVYMEISLEARPKRGYVVLSVDLDEVSAIHDLIGGDKRQIKEAHKRFTTGAEPMWRFEIVGDERRLYVHMWPFWNPIDGTGSERQARLREQKKRQSDRYVDRDIGDGDGDGSGDDPVTGHVTPVTDTSARGRANLLSSPSDSSGSLPESSLKIATAVRERGALPPADPHERYVQPSDKITDELRSAAQLATVQDVDAAWLKFCGARAGQWLHVQGAWQAWCVSWARNERTEREERRAKEGPTSPLGDGPRGREERRARDAAWREAEANRSPAPVADLMAAIGARLPKAEGGTQ